MLINITTGDKDGSQSDGTDGTLLAYGLDKGKEGASNIERLQQFFIANKITEAQRKVAVLLTVIGSKAYSQSDANQCFTGDTSPVMTE